MQDKKILIIISLLSILGIGFFTYNEVKPKPGTEIPDLGRGHVALGTKIDYNSNPPTSGPHFEVWTQAGVYDTPKEDRNLVHSLEHGYVIISYNCDKKQVSLPGFISQVNAQQQMQVLSTQTEATVSSQEAKPLSESFKSSDCQNLKEQLKKIYDDNGPSKIIVVPRPELDTRIALTAWRYLEEFDQFDKSRIEKFISAHKNQGPEKTVE
jgi:hypothetical protein